mgnify:CR=1 FL=1
MYRKKNYYLIDITAQGLRWLGSQEQPQWWDHAQSLGWGLDIDLPYCVGTYGEIRRGLLAKIVSYVNRADNKFIPVLESLGKAAEAICLADEMSDGVRFGEQERPAGTLYSGWAGTGN